MIPLSTRPAAALLGLAFWRRGEMEEAHQALAVPSVVSGCEAQAEAIPATMNKVSNKTNSKNGLFDFQWIASGIVFLCSKCFVI
jgi:hypothetical protein